MGSGSEQHSHYRTKIEKKHVEAPYLATYVDNKRKLMHVENGSNAVGGAEVGEALLHMP